MELFGFGWVGVFCLLFFVQLVLFVCLVQLVGVFLFGVLFVVGCFFVCVAWGFF